MQLRVSRSTGGDDPPTAGRVDRPVRTVLAAVVLVVLVALAGCGGDGGTSPTATATAEPADQSTPTPTATATPTATGTATPSEAPESTTDLPVEADTVYDRTAGLLWTGTSMPTIEVVDERSSATNQLPNHYQVFVVETGGATGSRPIATYDRGTVTVYAPMVQQASAAEVERALVRNYVHYIQDQEGWLGPAETAQDDITGEAYRLGMAEFTLAAYEDEYMNATSMDALEQTYQNGRTGARYRVAPRVVGFDYYDGRIDDGSEVSNVVGDPPRTSEQLLHATDEQPGGLSIEQNVDVTDWLVEGHGPQGELSTALVLRDQLPADRAFPAAAGWSVDQLYFIRRPADDLRGWVWFHQWENASETDEFVDAANEYLSDRRAAGNQYEFRFNRIGDRTTVFVAGESAFLEEIEITGNDDRINMTIGGGR